MLGAHSSNEKSTGDFPNDHELNFTEVDGILRAVLGILERSLL